MYHPPRFILASASPRRRELLTRAGYEFDVVPPEVDEARVGGESVYEHVTRLARAKAGAVAATHPDRMVIGADTVVVADGVLLGKPQDWREAAVMLRTLSARSHEVVTGVALVTATSCRTAVESTVVSFVALNDAVIDWYVATGEPLDKAGAYGAQGLGSRFVDRVDGSYTNVVGLPIAVVARLFSEAWSQGQDGA